VNTERGRKADRDRPVSGTHRPSAHASSRPVAADPLANNSSAFTQWRHTRHLFLWGLSRRVRQVDLLEDIRLALWASARNALRAGRWEEADPLLRIGGGIRLLTLQDSEPSAKAATQDLIRLRVAAFAGTRCSLAMPIPGRRIGASDRGQTQPRQTKRRNLPQPEAENLLETADETAMKNRP